MCSLLPHLTPRRSSAPQSGKTIGTADLKTIANVTDAGACCDLCTADARCAAWTHHVPPTSSCWLKTNTADSGRPVDAHNRTCSGLRNGALPDAFACHAGFDHFPFCDVALPTADRVADLVARINDTDKPNLLTARGLGGKGDHMQAIPALGVPAYYWGTNCLHSMNGGSCVVDSRNVSRCPTNFPSGPSFGATFDRGLVRSMARVVGVELRAMFALKLGAHYMSLDCWGPVVNLNRDPRWGRNGEGGLEDAYAMGQLAQAWTKGFQSPRPALKIRLADIRSRRRREKGFQSPRPALGRSNYGSSNVNGSSNYGSSNGSSNGGSAAAAAAAAAAPEPPRTLLQGVMTLKHMAANSLENTEPFNRHTFDANATYGVDPFVMRDYYLRPFERAIRGADARGIMCSYNSALGVPTCLSKVIRGARQEWGFRGYVTSDSDSVRDAYANHHYVPDGENATALALRDGQTDIDSGDTYNTFVAAAVAHGTAGLRQADVDRALTNSLRQRFDLGLFDPPSAYAWPGVDDVGTDASLAMSLRASQEALVLLRNDGALLPLAPGGKVAVLGPHAAAQKVLMQPYPFSPFCPDHTNDCLASPFAAIAALNGGNATTSTAAGCDLFDPSEAGFAEALAAARAADTVVLGLGIETCGMDPAHNVNPQKPGRCYQEKSTAGYVHSPLVTD